MENIRPRSTEILPSDQLKPENTVLMNYSLEYPSQRGYWFDVLIKKVKLTRRGTEIIGDISLGKHHAGLKNCRLMFVDDIFKIKPYTLVAERTPLDDQLIQTEPVELSNYK